MRWWLTCALVLGACSRGGDPVDVGEPLPSEIVDGVAFSADTRVMESFPVQLQPVLTLRNTGSSAAAVVFPDGCIVQLQLYAAGARTGAPVWEQSRTMACTAALVEVQLAAGETRELPGGTVSAAEILGDSLPAGSYHFAVVARPGGRRTTLTAGSAELAK